MARVELDIDGLADGHLKINPRGRGSGIFADMRVYEIKVKDLSYDSMRFKGRLQNGILSFDELKTYRKRSGNKRQSGNRGIAGFRKCRRLGKPAYA